MSESKINDFTLIAVGNLVRVIRNPQTGSDSPLTSDEEVMISQAREIDNLRKESDKWQKSYEDEVVRRFKDVDYLAAENKQSKLRFDEAVQSCQLGDLAFLEQNERANSLENELDIIENELNPLTDIKSTDKTAADAIKRIKNELVCLRDENKQLKRNEAVCHCGESISMHHIGSGHSPVPMVEECPYAYELFQAKKSISNVHSEIDNSGIIMPRDQTKQGLTPRVKSIIARKREADEQIRLLTVENNKLLEESVLYNGYYDMYLKEKHRAEQAENKITTLKNLL